MSTLHGEPAYPGDRVYSTIDGWGTVESVTHNCLWVNIGKRTKRKYDTKGFTGKRCSPDLEWHKPPRVRFAKNTCQAEKQRVFIESAVQLLSTMSDSCQCEGATVVDTPDACCDCTCD